jgi:hypothetical protein
MAGPEHVAALAVRLLSGALRRLQLRFTDVHVRYVDGAAAPAHPFACGVTLSELSITTRESPPAAAAADGAPGPARKDLRIARFAAYWSSDIDRAAAAGGGDGGDAADGEALLRPLDVVGSVELSPAGSNADGGAGRAPLAALALTVDAADVEARPAAVRDIVALVESLAARSAARAARADAAGAGRPAGPGYRGRYGEWWRYAIAVAVRGVRERRAGWRPERLLRAAREAREYAVRRRSRRRRPPSLRCLQRWLQRMQRSAYSVPLYLL